MKLRLCVFLMLSFLSGLFEIGSILWMLILGHATWAPFLAAFVYQLGAAAASMNIGRVGRSALVSLAFLSAALVFWRADLASMAFGILVASALINITRMDMGKSEISTTAKRVARVSGFLVAPAFLLPWFVPVAFVLAALVGLASVVVCLKAAPPVLPSSAGKGIFAMIKLSLIVHQMHYFTYSTVVVVVLAERYPAMVAVLVFTMGWVSYISVPHLIGQRLQPMLAALIGHICLPLVLLGMWLVPHHSAGWAALWIATGLFGGTVVYLTSYARQSFSVPERELTALENLGHCLGSTVALIFVAAGSSTATLLPVAAIFAGVTAVFILASSRKPRHLTSSAVGITS